MRVRLAAFAATLALVGPALSRADDPKPAGKIYAVIKTEKGDIKLRSWTSRASRAN